MITTIEADTIEEAQSEMFHAFRDTQEGISKTAALLRSILVRLNNASEPLDPLKDDKNIVVDARDVIAVALATLPEAYGKEYDKCSHGEDKITAVLMGMTGK